MAYTTVQLITGAYYASGVVSRDFETLIGSEASDGLNWLNDIITEKRVDEGMIPYETTYNFNSQIGVEKYFIPNLIQIDTLVFFLDQVRYAMHYTKRNQYFGSPRVENINTLPFEWYWERETGGGSVYIYFKPDRNYPIEIHGTFALDSVSLNQDLTSNITTADLGIPQFFGLGSLSPGQLVVNNFDLMGNYSSIGALINYINTGIIPGVVAGFGLTVNDFALFSDTQPPVSIYIQTNGFPPNGTTIKTNVTVLSSLNLNAIYNNGVNGVGATLTSVIPQVLIVDSYTPALGDSILVSGQDDLTQNGIYTLTTVGSISVQWVLTRAFYYNIPIEINIGNVFTLLSGINAGNSYVQTSDVSVIGISPITFSIFNALTFSNFSTIQTPFYEIYNPAGFDQFYITYLRYALADRICSEYNYDTPPNVMRQLSKYESWIKSKSRIIDLEMTKVSTLQKRGTFNWAFINLGKGWQRPG